MEQWYGNKHRSGLQPPQVNLHSLNMSRIVNLKRIAAMMLAAMVVLNVQISIAPGKQIDRDRLLDPNRRVDIRIEMSPKFQSLVTSATRNHTPSALTDLTR